MTPSSNAVTGGADCTTSVVGTFVGASLGARLFDSTDGNIVGNQAVGAAAQEYDQLVRETVELLEWRGSAVVG